jgi:hypothetical protein
MLSENNRNLINEKPTKSYEYDLVGWIYAELPEIYQDYVDRVAQENGVTQLELYPLMCGIQQMLRAAEQRTLLLHVVQQHYVSLGYPLSIAC